MKKNNPLPNKIIEWTDLKTFTDYKVSVDFEIDSPEFYIVGLKIDGQEKDLSEINKPFEPDFYKLIHEFIEQERIEMNQGLIDSAIDRKYGI